MSAAAPAAPAAPAASAATPANVAVPVAKANPPTPAAPGAPAAKADAAAEAPFIELVVDGQKQKFTEGEAKRLLSKAAFADKLVRQAKEAIKKAQEASGLSESEKKRLKEETEAYLEAQGVDVDALARKRLERRLAEREMTPEQKQRRELEDENTRLKEKEAKRESAEKQRQQSELATRMQRKMEADLRSAADRAGLPNGADSFYAVYEAVREFHELGLPFDADRIIETAKENIEGSFKRLESSVLKDLKGKALVDRLGKSVVDEVLRYKVEELRNGGARKTEPPASPPAQQQQQTDGPGYLTPDEAREKLRGLGR